ncbi:MAG TPA: efflux RND transporter periplasmic adaptor subunit [Candidatus Brocadiia bacterium]|nr:efflux RND transporter periplasmic adaptor subunit [Candidatus Brocadiia bacterium]
MNLVRWTAAVVLAGVAAAVLKPGREAPREAPTLTAPVERRGFAIVTRAAGELDAANAVWLTSEATGDSCKIVFLVADGKQVEKGEVVARLDPATFKDRVARLSSELAEARALEWALEQSLEFEKNQADKELKTAEYEARVAELDLVRLEKGDGPFELARLESAMLKAKREYEEKSGYLDDLEKLKERGFANPAEIAQARNRASELKQTYDAARQQWENYKSFSLPAMLEKARAGVERSRTAIDQARTGGGFRVGKAMAALRQARQTAERTAASLKEAQAELERSVIRAPIAGMAVLPTGFFLTESRKPRVGDSVFMNQPLVYLPDTSRMLVNTLIREADLHKVSPGSPAVVCVDAYPDLRLKGKVASIGALASRVSQASGKWFQVRLDLDEGDARLRPGMSARVEIDCGRVADALCVPVQSLFGAGRKRICYVQKGGSFVEREVEVGRRNEEWAEVVSGLEEGERVALSLPPEPAIASAAGGRSRP